MAKDGNISWRNKPQAKIPFWRPSRLFYYVENELSMAYDVGKKFFMGRNFLRLNKDSSSYWNLLSSYYILDIHKII